MHIIEKGGEMDPEIKSPSVQRINAPALKTREEKKSP